MPVFNTTLRSALRKHERRLVLIALVTLKRSDPALSFQFTATLAAGGFVRPFSIMSNPDWGGDLGGLGMDPIVESVGKHLLGQDYMLYGDASTSGAITFRDIPPGFSKSMFRVMGLDDPQSLSEVIDAGFNPIGQEIRLYLGDISVESGTNSIAEIIGLFHCIGIEYSKGFVHLLVADEKPWNRQAPLIRLNNKDMGDDWPRDLNTPHAGKPMPYHYGYRGRSQVMWGFPGNPETSTNLARFRGRADPINPAPCVLIEPDMQEPFGTETGRMLWGLHETGRLTPYPWYNWQNEGVFLYVDGRFAYLGTLSTDGSTGMRPLTRFARNPVNPTDDIDILTFSMDPDAIYGYIPIYPTKDAGTEGNWTSHLVAGYKDNPSAMFNGELRTALSLVNLNDTVNYVRKWQDLGTYTNLGSVYGLEGFAVITMQSGCIADYRMSLDVTGSSPIEVDSLAVNGSAIGAMHVLTFNFSSALTIPVVGFDYASAIKDWRYEYQASGQDYFLPMRLGIAAKKNAGSSNDVNVLFHCVGLTVKFTPNAIRDASSWTRINYGLPGGPALPLPGYVSPYFTTDKEARPIDIYLSGAAQQDDGDGIYSGTPSWTITSPVGMLWHQLYEKIGLPGSPAPQGPQHDFKGGHGQWILSRETLDTLPGVLIGQPPPMYPVWRSVYSQTEFVDGVWDIVQEFMSHLPLVVWKDRTHQLRCALWYPDKVSGLDWTPPSEYFYEPPLDASQIINVKSVRMSPLADVYNEIVVDWDYHEGQQRYLHQAIINGQTTDDGLNAEWIPFDGDVHNSMAAESESLVGRRTLNVKARTVYRSQEAVCLLYCFIRKYARRHIELELDLDISCGDLEPMEFVTFRPGAMLERWGRDVVPLLGGKWEDQYFRVVRRFVDYDNLSVSVTLRSVLGAF